MSAESFDLDLASATLVDLLRSRAESQPERRAYTFLVNGEREQVAWTYADLDRRARAIGAYLQQQGRQGERALLIYPPGLDYIAAFFGCLYAGVIAVPAYPPNPARLERTLPRLESIATDARPALALVTSPILALAEHLLAQAPKLRALHWLATDDITDEMADSWVRPALDEATTAFLQYTSGSTSTPKGVVLTHANLLHNSSLIYSYFDHSPQSRGVIWLPPYHDMGLIGGIIQPLYGGFPVTLMSPVDFLQNPFRWLDAISREQATTSGGPNFAYDLCIRKTTPEQRATLDLSQWRVAFNGAEPIRPDVLRRFAEVFADCGFRYESFYPCYGLAEATLIVSGGPVADPPMVRTFRGAALERHDVAEIAAAETNDRVLVGCGGARAGQRIAIVDPQSLTACPPERVGEIWVMGPSVAQGYWNNAAATAQTFQASIEGREGPFLRTGDLGFVYQDELFITGRIKDLLIIRGRNHYPQDIEATVERSHTALRRGGGAAFTVDIDGEERLVIAHEVERQHRHNLDSEEIAGAIRQVVAEGHDIQAYAVALLKPGSLPKTSSGKIQRLACREDFLADKLETIGVSILESADMAIDPRLAAQPFDRAALTAAEPAQRRALLVSYLRHQLAQALGVAVWLDEQQPFTTLGLDSLKALELKGRIEADLGIDLPLVRFMERSTIAELAAELMDLLDAVDVPAEESLMAERLLANLDQLPDDEVESWLQQLGPVKE